MQSELQPKNHTNLMLEDVTAFLKKVPPFQFLDDDELQAVARNLSMEFYSRDTVILKQDGAPSDALRIIKNGSVKVSMVSGDGDEVVIDHRGAGGTFGFLSLVGRDRIRLNVIAMEDTTCYLLGKEMLLKLLDSHRSFTEYFLKSHITKYIDRTYSGKPDKAMFYGGSDRLLFTTRVGDLGGRGVVSTREDTTIHEAARIMAENRISSIVVIDRNNLPAGMVTDRDLREKVVAKGRNVREPVRNIMSASLIRVDARDFCFEAVLKMIKYNIHHILVVRDGLLAGMITNHDLMMLQGTSPLSLTKDIEGQQSIEGLVPVSKKINNIVGLLLREGAKASNITKVITEINDRLLRKVVEFAERKIGKPPLPYCWIVFGSEGRKEQIFRTDQDNALVYADPATPEQEEQARAYFTRLALSIRDGMMKCGYPYCPDNTMAVNSQWRQPLSVWKKQYLSWVNPSSPETAVRFRIFFDLRFLCGDEAIAAELRKTMTAGLKDGNDLLENLAAAMVRSKPSLGFFRTFLVEKEGEHKDLLNLKERGIAPLVDVVRLFALETGVSETSTLDRIECLRGKHPAIDAMGDELAQAFEFMMLLRTRHQAEQHKQGRMPDSHLDPDRLSTLDKRMLKESFQVIGRAQAAAGRIGGG